VWSNSDATSDGGARLDKKPSEKPLDVAGTTTAVFGPLDPMLRTFCNAVDAAQQTRPHGVSAGAGSGSTGCEAPNNHLLRAGDLARPFIMRHVKAKSFLGES